MTDNAWNLLARAGVRPEDIEAICVLADRHFTEIPVAEAQARLEAVEIFTDFDDPAWNGEPALPRAQEFHMQVWTQDWIYRTRDYDGIVKLDAIARTVDVLVKST